MLRCDSNPLILRHKNISNQTITEKIPRWEQRLKETGYLRCICRVFCLRSVTMKEHFWTNSSQMRVNTITWLTTQKQLIVFTLAFITLSKIKGSFTNWANSCQSLIIWVWRRFPIIWLMHSLSCYVRGLLSQEFLLT